MIAVDELVACMPRLSWYAGKFRKHGRTREDLVQMTLLRAWRYRDNFDPSISRLSTWLTTLMHRLVLNENDERNAIDLMDIAETGRDVARADKAYVANGGFDLVNGEQAIASLRPQARELFLARAGGKSRTELAQDFGIPKHKVSSTLRAARLKLQEFA